MKERGMMRSDARKRLELKPRGMKTSEARKRDDSGKILYLKFRCGQDVAPVEEIPADNVINNQRFF